ncbi:MULTISPECIES: class I adenylate-forming enzyme family protein [unclassified Streptomyces]|uniref:class I adenylate-forming enzyme family protein n=1 Tax=unclassified Streptomyces TaxID=2593676 RepID=UPI00365DE8AB
MSARYVTDLVEAFELHAGRPAIGAGRDVKDFSEVLSDVYRLAGALADAGVRPGSGLACVTGGNRPEVLLVRLAAHVLGGRLTQMVIDAAAYGLEFVLRECEPDLVVHDTPVPDTGAARVSLDEVLASAAARAAEPVPVRAREDDIARVTYTGGTTGLPKGVASTFRALAARADGHGSRDEHDRPVFLSVTSLAHRSGGRCLEELRTGGRVEILATFGTREFAAACRRLGPVSTYLMPAMVYRLLNDPATADGIPGLRVISYGASPILPERLAQAVSRWGGRWQQGYGSNESAVICRLTPADHDAATAGRPELLTSVGRPAPGVDVQVRDEHGGLRPPGRTGEVWTRSGAMMAGYWNRPDLTAEVIKDGWLRIGDLGHFDSAGYLHLDDRVNDVVMVDGDNVYCLPVEAALARHPAVAEAVVVGRHSELTGEEVCAFLVPAPGCAPDAEAAAEACDLVEKALAPAHRPTAVFWARDVPLTAQGKPDKRRLRERAEQRAGDSGLGFPRCRAGRPGRI